MPWFPPKPDERGTRRSAGRAITLCREGRVDEAMDVNPMATEMFIAWREKYPHYDGEIAEALTLWDLFIEPLLELDALEQRLREGGES